MVIDATMSAFLVSGWENETLYDMKIYQEIGHFPFDIENYQSVWHQTHLRQAIIPVLKISTYIITSLTARPVRLAVILAIMSVSTFKIAIILCWFLSIMWVFFLWSQQVIFLVSMEWLWKLSVSMMSNTLWFW